MPALAKRGIAALLAAYCLGLSAVRAPAAAAYSATSPHWTHINVVDFGRGVKYITPTSSRTIALDWYAAHMDGLEVGMTSLSSFYVAAGIEYYLNAPYLKSINPTIKPFGYDYDLTMCQHVYCNWGNPLIQAFDNLPEDYYLHFSSDTQLRFVGLTGNVVTTVTITGCPVSMAVSKSCRVQTFGWADARWLPHLASAGWRQWRADQFVEEVTRSTNPVDGLFLDEHGPGFSLPMSWGYHTVPIYGGQIREYGGAVPRLYNNPWGAYDELDRRYNADAASWLAYLKTRLQAVGKFARINTSGYTTAPLSADQVLAANGVMTEHLNTADGIVEGPPQYEQLADTLTTLVANGGTADLYGTPCTIGPAGYTAGNYSTSTARYRMWGLASYYILKEPAGSPGTVYFNPTLCVDNTLGFIDEWLPAYEVDIGQPTGARTVYQQGAGACGVRNYKIFARPYERALVLVRPKDDRSCSNYNDAATVALPSSMSILNQDGTLSAPTSSLQLRNSEAVILFPNPPPAHPRNLRLR